LALLNIFTAKNLSLIGEVAGTLDLDSSWSLRVFSEASLIWLLILLLSLLISVVAWS